MLCPKCGAQLSDSAVICRACGAMLPEQPVAPKAPYPPASQPAEPTASAQPAAPRTCTKCGAPLDDGVRFCTNCGAPAPEPSAPSDTTRSASAGREAALIQLDDWYYDYGKAIDDCYVYDDDSLDASDVREIQRELGVRIDDNVIVACDVTYQNGQDNDFYFEFVQVDGQWYLLFVVE